MNTIPCRRSFLVVWVLVSLASPFPVSGQRPASNIFLFDLDPGANMPLRHPRMLTSFNNGGYNDQPAFFTPEEIWFTSDFKDTSQTDIWAANLRSLELRRITRTQASEFSPTRMPGGQNWSTVLIEADGRQTQRLWTYPFHPDQQATPCFPAISGVGYHAWISRDSVALYLVGDPPTLQLANRSSDEPAFLTTKIGRCLSVNAAGHLLFVQKVTDDAWYIKAYDPVSDRTRIIVKALPEAEDFCLLPDGSILMALKGVIHRYRPEQDITWQPWANLESFGFRHITRMAYGRNGTLAVVEQLTL